MFEVKFTQELAESAVREYINSKESMANIAKKYDISYGSLRNWILKLGYEIEKNHAVLKENNVTLNNENQGEWRNVVGYDGLYVVNKDGIVKRVESVVRFKNFYKKVNEKITYKCINKEGYVILYLCKNGKLKTRSLHRIIAEAFIQNPENKPQINHKNGIKNDNCIENLEWCTAKENIIHSYNILHKKHNCIGMLNKGGKRVQQFDLSGNFIKEWNSTMDIQRELKIANTHISACCLGKSKTAGGYKWNYLLNENRYGRN